MQTVPFDAFEELRTSVIDAGNGEPIEPPLEDGESRKGWYIVGFTASQSTVYSQKEEADALDLLAKVEEGIESLKEQAGQTPADLDEHLELLRETIRGVDRTVYVLWGKAKKASVAPTLPAPDAKPEG
jgi:hypothetical protein